MPSESGEWTSLLEPSALICTVVTCELGIRLLSVCSETFRPPDEPGVETEFVHAVDKYIQ
jgi:hypothetical protein